ncbi:MAG: hypothetical protein KatS3mg068_1419 [Candidatus Sericytochromatia bacterium]|nr:MAG: hypothetical protein KatS3mg068_1419 [Candidatus Sericytochromatia bacterium]
MKFDNLISLIQKSKIFQNFINNLSKEKPYKIVCSNIGTKALFLSPLFNKDNFFIIIVHSKEEQVFLSTFFNLIGYKNYDIFPTLELSPYESVLTDVNLISKQYEIIENIRNKKINCVITRPKGLFQKIILDKNFLTIRKEQILQPEKLVKDLIRLGYKQVDNVEERGQFSKKGGYINIYPSGYSDILKIEFFDNEIEHIYKYDVNQKKNLESFDFINIYSTYRFSIPEEVNIDIIKKSLMDQVIELVSRKLEKKR